MAALRLPGYKPLCYIKQVLYLYKKGFIYALVNDRPQKVIRVYKKSAKECMRIFSRLFRTEPKFAVPINESAMILVGHHTMKIVDVEKRTVKDIGSSREGFSDPLNVCVGKEEWLVLWGDYGSNTNHDVINIYGLTVKNEAEVVYTFKKGQVRHIHNIIPKISGGYYIFTGDQETQAGIYEADTLFTKVKPVKIGMQQYRSVVGFDTEKGLLYATDAVNEKNYVYVLREKSESEIVCELNGSCIYGTELQGKYYFSTTVEPDENNRGITSWISHKRGKGILSDEVCLVEVDNELKSKIILKYKKDALPMKLMQYGTIQFPRGNAKELWCYPVAVKKHDGNALRVK